MAIAHHGGDVLEVDYPNRVRGCHPLQVLHDRLASGKAPLSDGGDDRGYVRQLTRRPVLNMEYLVSLDLYRLARPALRLPIVDAIVVRVGDYAFQERIGEIAVAAPGVVRSSFKGDCRQMLEYVRDGPLLFCFETVIVNRVPEAQRIKESLPDVSPALYRFVGHAQAPAGFGYLGFVRLLLFRRPRDDIIAVEGNLAYGQEEALHRRDRKG